MCLATPVSLRRASHHTAHSAITCRAHLHHMGCVFQALLDTVICCWIVPVCSIGVGTVLLHCLWSDLLVWTSKQVWTWCWCCLNIKFVFCPLHLTFVLLFLFISPISLVWCEAKTWPQCFDIAFRKAGARLVKSIALFNVTGCILHFVFTPWSHKQCTLLQGNTVMGVETLWWFCSNRCWEYAIVPPRLNPWTPFVLRGTT